MPHSSNPPHMRYRPDIDGLRAIAVLAVVLYHAFPEWLPGGFVGVDVFFVISGFLISRILFTSLTRGEFDLADFYSKRIRRIFPVLLLVLLFTYAVGWWTIFPEQFKPLVRQIAAGVGFVSNLLSWSEAGYFDPSSESKPLLHLWSLGIEEQFYLAWPIILWLAWKQRLNMLALIVALVVVSFWLNLWLTGTDTTAAFYSPLPRFWELGVGGMLAWVTHSRPIDLLKAPKSRQAPSWLIELLNDAQDMENAHGKILRNLCALTGISMIVAAACRLHPEMAFPGKWALLPTVGAVLVLAAGPVAWPNRRVLSSRMMVYVGLISYPLYLWHWPLLSFIHVLGQDIPADSLPAIRTGAVLAAFLLAAISYHWVELPLRRLGVNRRKVQALSSAMLLTGVISGISYWNNGLPVRFPSELRPLLEITDSRAFFHWYDGVRRDEGCYDDAATNMAYARTACIEDSRPLLFVWGDSYAASLYPGLHALQQNHSFGVAQITQGSTPPYRVERAKNPNWESFYREQLKTLAQVKPDIVLLHAEWSGYGFSEQQTATLLEGTFRDIRSVSAASRIVVLGPVPQWKDVMRHSIVRYSMSQDPKGVPPTYMSYGLYQSVRDWDRYMGELVPKLGGDYLSAIHVLCRENACLTRTGPELTDMTTIDYGHLSPSGSKYLLQHLEPSFTALLNLPGKNQSLADQGEPGKARNGAGEHKAGT